MLDDAVRHMNMLVWFKDLKKVREGDAIQFPTTRLENVARELSMQGLFAMMTLPIKW